MYEQTNEVKFEALLSKAVSEPGTMMKAYSLFWNYSMGNQLLALIQSSARNIPLGPIASFNRWKDLGRYVKKGEKAIELCMPITGKRTVTGTDGVEEVITFKRFVFKRNWFMLSQTDGKAFEVPAAPNWDRAKALAALNVTEVPFELMNGNVQGYAIRRELAINPIAQLPIKTTFHELGHIELGHTAEGMADSENTPRNIREVEAECVALLCLESLGLPGAEFCRGYIQSWLQSDRIPERSAQKIFTAADRILKAGLPQISREN